MTTYFYKATDSSGEIIEGDIEAVDYQGALQKVRNLDYFPIKITQEREASSWIKQLNIPTTVTLSILKISSVELMNFTQQLATLISSKLTLDKSLTIVTQLTEKKSTRDIFHDIQKRVHAGSRFADALAAYPGVFSKMYVNMVRAGELGGVLDVVLKRLADFLENAEETKGKIVNAMIYPAILITAGAGAIVFLMTFVVPKLSGMFDGREAAIPLITRVLLNTSALMSQYWWSFGIGLFLMMFAFWAFIKSDLGKNLWDRLVLKLPLFGDLVRKIEMSRFSQTMASLLNSGVPVLQSLDVVRSVINNQVIASSMEPLKEGLKSGQGISRPLQNSKVFPPLAVHMIVVGEETGDLENMLIKVSNTYDKEVDNAIQRILKLLGPILVLTIGGGIILIVASILIGMIEVTDIII
jgi:general secretion pathway protein F